MVRDALGRLSDIDITRIEAFIQAHPARKHLLPPLLHALEPMPTWVSLHSSDPSNPWEGYKQAAKLALSRRGPTHACILQEDVTPCRNFPLAVLAIARSQPDRPVVLFLARLPGPTAIDALRAAKDGKRYVPLRPSSKFCPVVGMLWPMAALERFIEWAEVSKLPGRPNPASDDAIVGEWLRRNQKTEQILVACPSIIEHEDLVESIWKHRAPGWAKDANRTAVNFIGDRDPLELDW